VKFHVSSLLAKFRVRGRMELVREASRSTFGNLPLALPTATREAHAFPAIGANFPPVNPRTAAVVPLAPKRHMMA